MERKQSFSTTIRLPEDLTTRVLFIAGEYWLSTSQVIRACISLVKKSWFYLGVERNPIVENEIKVGEPFTPGAVEIVGQEDNDTFDTPKTNEVKIPAINPNYKTPKELAEMAQAEEKAKEKAEAVARAKAESEAKIKEEERKMGLTDDEHDIQDQRDMVDLYSPSRPDFQPLTQAEFIAIPMDAKTEALRNLRRFEPELADYYTYQNAETTRKTLTMPEREVDETIDTYNIDAPAIPSDWVISKELLFFPSETVETPNWPITYQNILIKRLHPLTERDHIDSLLDTNRISEFFPQKIVEQIKKYDDGVMPKKLYESRVARQVARRNEDKKQKEDEEFEKMLEQD